MMPEIARLEILGSLFWMRADTYSTQVVFVGVERSLGSRVCEPGRPPLLGDWFGVKAV